MQLKSDSFLHRRAMPTRCAFGRYRFYPADLEPHERVELSDNENPHLAWEGAPEGTRSFALLCFDRDAPMDRTGVNVAGRVIPREAPRTEFVHWTLIDVPSTRSSIAAAELSAGVTARGKRESIGPVGRQGLNDYTAWFQGDPSMEGRYFGYDGPAPPWNDELIHWYVFELFAVNVEHLDVEGELDATALRAALSGRVLAKAELEGFYYINPDARFR